MWHIKLIAVMGILLFNTQSLSAAPQQLLEAPLDSPGDKYSANVEWDSAGFIGRIRMLIWTNGSGSPTTVVELPQMQPSPANLQWLTPDWIACESFIAERGAAFFYVNVPREKGYLIEILAPEKDGDWMISYTTNDSVSSSSIHTLSEDHSSLFPILLRNLPEEGLGYISPDFPYLLADAVDSYTEWRKRQGFTEMEFLTKIAEDPDKGRLIIASFDNSAEIVYFPQGTTTTREMLALTRREPLPPAIQKIIHGVDPPNLKIEWTGNDGEFRVLASQQDDGSSATQLLAGRFEGVSDTKYTGPGVQELLNGKSDSEDEHDESDSDEDSDKDPSRSDD